MLSSFSMALVGSSTMLREPERALLSISVSVSNYRNTYYFSSNSVLHSAEKVQSIVGKFTGNAEKGEVATIIDHKKSDVIRKKSDNCTTHTDTVKFWLKFGNASKLEKVAKQLEAIPATVLNVQWQWSDITLKELAPDARIASAKNALAKASDYAKVFGYNNVTPLELQVEKDGEVWADWVDQEGNITIDGKKGENGKFLLGSRENSFSVSSTVNAKFTVTPYKGALHGV